MSERDISEDTQVLLVAYDGGPMSEAQLHLACRSANDFNGTVRVLHVVERPAQLPLPAPLTPDEDAHLERLMDRVERIAARYGVQCAIAVVRARSVAEAVVAEAREVSARSIFIGLRERKRRGATLMLSSTVRHILQHAPCPVQIGYLPAGLPERFALTDEPESD